MGFELVVSIKVFRPLTGNRTRYCWVGSANASSVLTRHPPPTTQTRKLAKAIVTLNRPMNFKSIFSFNKSLLGTKTPSLSAKKFDAGERFFFSKVLKKQKKCQLEKQTRFGKKEA